MFYFCICICICILVRSNNKSSISCFTSGFMSFTLRQCLSACLRGYFPLPRNEQTNSGIEKNHIIPALNCSQTGRPRSQPLVSKSSGLLFRFQLNFSFKTFHYNLNQQLAAAQSKVAAFTFFGTNCFHPLTIDLKNSLF